MKTLKEALISKSNRDWISVGNKYGITEKDMIGDLEGFPVGVVVKMLEETELQGNKPNVKIFQSCSASGYGRGGFRWTNTKNGHDFWVKIINHQDFDRFFKKYPDYKKYN